MSFGLTGDAFNGAKRRLGNAKQSIGWAWQDFRYWFDLKDQVNEVRLENEWLRADLGRAATELMEARRQIDELVNTGPSTEVKRLAAANEACQRLGESLDSAVLGRLQWREHALDLALEVTTSSSVFAAIFRPFMSADLLEGSKRRRELAKTLLGVGKVVDDTVVSAD